MAKVYIAEFNDTGVSTGANVPVAPLPPAASQTLVPTGASAQSAAFRADTTCIRVISDVNVSIAVGANPTATVGSLLLAAGAAEYFAVPGGAKLAAILAG